jgi:hypothetical protein
VFVGAQRGCAYSWQDAIYRLRTRSAARI